mmetsp:Transcript_12472/g.38139  ORF Transcript_12472/g.38139 Transcript_12472/m.38139 type:complete len:145 (+) Transcript_12472:292-726(+)
MCHSATDSGKATAAISVSSSTTLSFDLRIHCCKAHRNKMRRSRLVARTTRSARIGGRCLGALFSGDSRQLALETTWAADAWEKGGEAQPNVADALGEHVRACTGGLNTESLSTAALSSKKSGRARLAVVMPRCAGGRIGERVGE